MARLASRVSGFHGQEASTRRIRIVAAIVSSLGLLFLGAPAASAPTERVDRADRPSSVPHPANGPLVFHYTVDTFVVQPHDPEQYYTLRHGYSAVSPNGRRLAFTESVQTPTSSHSELFVSALDGSHERVVTDESLYPGEQRAGTTPAWSPDGRQIVVNYGDGLWIFSVRTGRVVQRLTKPSRFSDVEPTWSPDGTGLRRFTTPPEGDRDLHPDWSPDGRWLLMKTSRWTPRNELTRTWRLSRETARRSASSRSFDGRSGSSNRRGLRTDARSRSPA